MNIIINKLFYFLWKLLNPISFISYLFSRSYNSKLNLKKAYLGYNEDLASVSNEITSELYSNPEFIKHVEKAKKSKDEFGFLIDCLPYLSEKLKNNLYNIARFNKNINSIASNFLGIKPTLNTILIYANVPRENDLEIGSKQWHRDGNTFIAGDFMFAINEINDFNGPFFYIEPLDFGMNHNFKSKINLGWSKGGRYTTEELQSFGLDTLKIKKFIGKPGDYIMLNTGESFHKGGFCTNEVRLLGRFVYSSFGYSNGNLEIFGIKKNWFSRVTNFLLMRLYSTHEKIYRNLINHFSN
uniref:hypothetical protein n=1 Tax=Algoriphagus sp. TaxID=1872435 RepID=UPI00404859E6